MADPGPPAGSRLSAPSASGDARSLAGLATRFICRFARYFQAAAIAANLLAIVVAVAVHGPLVQVGGFCLSGTAVTMIALSYVEVTARRAGGQSQSERIVVRRAMALRIPTLFVVTIFAFPPVVTPVSIFACAAAFIFLGRSRLAMERSLTQLMRYDEPPSGRRARRSVLGELARISALAGTFAGVGLIMSTLTFAAGVATRRWVIEIVIPRNRPTLPLPHVATTPKISSPSERERSSQDSTLTATVPGFSPGEECPPFLAQRGVSHAATRKIEELFRGTHPLGPAISGCPVSVHESESQGVPFVWALGENAAGQVLSLAVSSSALGSALYLQPAVPQILELVRAHTGCGRAAQLPAPSDRRRGCPDRKHAERDISAVEVGKGQERVGANLRTIASGRECCGNRSGPRSGHLAVAGNRVDKRLDGNLRASSAPDGTGPVCR